jgi:hypothetical protein
VSVSFVICSPGRHSALLFNVVMGVVTNTRPAPSQIISANHILTHASDESPPRHVRALCGLESATQSGNEPSPTWLRPRKNITRPLKTETHFGDEAACIMSRCPASLHTLGNLSIRLRNFRSYGDRQPSRRGRETHWQISSNQNPELNQSKSKSCCVTIGATVIANHHGVDARHRTVRISILH